MNLDTINLKNIHQSKTVRGIVVGLGIAVILLAVFHVGTIVGYHRARFENHFGNGFERNFVDQGKRGNFWGGGFDRHLPPSAHGATGKIVSINLPLIVVAGSDNLEKTVVVKDDTLIRQFQNQIAANDLKVGDSIVVLGTPNTDGQIEATLIRTIPRQAASPPATTTPTSQPAQ